MAMAMRTAAARVAATAKPCGLRGLFSTVGARPLPPEPSENLLVSGLSRHTTSERLREAFAFFGEVVDARVVPDRVSGYSKGFGFVRYATIEHAAEGIKGMDGKFLDGWAISAVYARPRPPPPGNNAGPPSYQPGYGSQFGQR